MTLNTRKPLLFSCLALLLALFAFALWLSMEPAGSIVEGMSIVDVTRKLEVDGDGRAGRLEPFFSPSSAVNGARKKSSKYNRYWENSDYVIEVTFLKVNETVGDADTVSAVRYNHKSSWFARLIRRIGY